MLVYQRVYQINSNTTGLRIQGADAQMHKKRWVFYSNHFHEMNQQKMLHFFVAKKKSSETFKLKIRYSYLLDWIVSSFHWPLNTKKPLT